MADPDADEQRSARLLTALVWGGVALAPIAVLVALIGGGDASLRFAVLLLAVAIVLIGSSMLIRNDPTLLRLDIDDRLAQGIEAVREEMRDEIAAAARATHHRVQTLQDDIVRFQSQRPPAAAQAQRPPAAAAQAQRPPAAAPQAQRPPAVPAQRAPGTTTGAVRAPGTTSGAVRVPGNTSGSVPVARAAAAVPPRPHVPPQAPPQLPPPQLPPPQLPAPERDYPESDYPEPDYGQETGRRADRRIPADRPIKTDRHAKSDSGRRARRRRAADEDDGYQVIPPMSPDRYESDRYGPDPQPASGRRAAPEGDRDDYPRW
jgi:hypothetical protein